MSRILASLSSLAQFAVVPATTLSPAPTTPLQSATIDGLNERTINGPDIVNALTEWARKDPSLTNKVDILFSLIKFQGGMNGPYLNEVSSLQRAFKAAFLRAPLTNHFSRLTRDFNELFKLHPTLDLDVPADQQVFKDFIKKFEDDSNIITDHTIQAITNANVIADKIGAAHIAISNPSAPSPVSKLGGYYAADFINSIPGSTMWEYYQHLSETQYATNITAQGFENKITSDILGLITESSVTTPISNLFNVAKTTPFAEIKKYGLSELTKRFEEDFSAAITDEEKSIKDLYKTFDADRNIANFEAILAQLKTEDATAGSPTTHISKIVDDVRAKLVTEVDADIQTYLNAHVKSISYTDAKNFATLKFEQLFDPAAATTFITKWNKNSSGTPIFPTNTFHIEINKEASTTIGQSQLSIKLTIGTTTSDAINGDSSKWHNVIIPVEITLKDLATEITNKATAGALGTIDSQITTLNLMALDGDPKHSNWINIVDLNTFQKLEDVIKLIPALSDLYPTADASSIFHMFVDRFPNLQVRVKSTKAATANLSTHTQDWEILLELKEDANSTTTEEVTLQIKNVPIFDEELFQKYAIAHQNALKAQMILSSGEVVPTYYGVEMQRIFDKFKWDDLAIAALAPNTPYKLPWTDMFELMGSGKAWNGTVLPNTTPTPGIISNVYKKIYQQPNPYEGLDSSNLDIVPDGGGLVVTKNADNTWKVVITYKVVSKLYMLGTNGEHIPAFASAPITQELMVISLETHITDAENELKDETKGFDPLFDGLRDNGVISQADRDKIQTEFDNLLNQFRIDARDTSKIKTQEDLEKLKDEYIKRIQSKALEMSKLIPNVANQIQPISDNLAATLAALTAAQTALDTAKAEQLRIDSDPNATPEQKEAAQKAVDEAQAKFDEAQKLSDLAMNTSKETLSHIGQAMGFVKEVFESDKSSEIKDSVLQEVIDYLKTADLSSIEAFQALKDLIDMPFEQSKVNLSQPMKYALIALGGFMGLVGAGTAFTTLRSIKTNKNISSLGDASPIEYQKPKKTMALKGIISVAALGAAAAVITLVLTLGGGL